MTKEKLYQNSSKICFFTLLLFITITICASYLLPSHQKAISHNTQCYWTDALLVYIECGNDVPLKEVISPILNYSYFLSVMTIMPLLIIFTAPILWIPIVSFYFLAFSYPISKIKRKIRGKPTQEKIDKFYKIITWLFIALVAISVFLQIRHDIIRSMF